MLELREEEKGFWKRRYDKVVRDFELERTRNEELKEAIRAEIEEKEMTKALMETFQKDFLEQEDWKKQCQSARSQLLEVSALCTAREEELKQVKEELEELKKKTDSEKYKQLMKAMLAYTKEES